MIICKLTAQCTDTYLGGGGTGHCPPPPNKKTGMGKKGESERQRRKRKKGSKVILDRKKQNGLLSPNYRLTNFGVMF